MSGLAVLNNELEAIAARCIHCGLCLEDCPTYLELGNEMDSPRGRILLMRAISGGTMQASETAIMHLDRCLDCRACEAVCPSGVQYSSLIEAARDAFPRPSVPTEPRSDRIMNRLIRFVMPHRARLRFALRIQGFIRRIGLTRLLENLAPAAKRLNAIAESAESSTPPEQARSAFAPPLRATVSLFAGCATAEMTPGTHAAARQVLEVNGCIAACRAGAACCGALHAHSGDLDGARKLAVRNLSAFEGDEPIVSFAAGCGAMLKEYARLFTGDPSRREAAVRFAARVRDISTFLVEIGPRPATTALPLRVTYHDACHHAHAQNIRGAPRELLRAIPGLTLVESPESAMCCGAAGAYHLTQPEIAARLARRKLDNLAVSRAHIVATGNIGCILHLQSHAGEGTRVVHFVELLHAAYGLSGTVDSGQSI
ncbi:MAG: 4Fe-4S dicluster domain-containing protein [Phycisphaerales bacterium]|nr:4Fe-4S dicluster domain-containing protein [Phycisphaerales bacterium]